jgi:predicted RNA-binding protein YlxR (DUF448 family)
VRTPEGRVELDSTGKRNGRGAYIHDQRVCWEQALKKHQLGRALKVTVASSDLAVLQKHVAALPLVFESEIEST